MPAVFEAKSSMSFILLAALINIVEKLGIFINETMPHDSSLQWGKTHRRFAVN